MGRGKARAFLALAAMFYLACLAFLSVTEGLGRDVGRCRKQAITSVVFGIPAALSMRDGHAAFLMFLLLGFSLDFWGLAKR
jgi:membrane-associated phospholipid phosphatase